jgi:glycosyltransferase involved in cell wall biosynthesis
MTSRKRILFSLLDAGLGGGQSVALSVAEQLIAEGHTVGVLVPAPGSASERFRTLGARVHTADLHSLRHTWSVGRATRHLGNYDVLYSHTSIPGEILGDLAARIARRQHVIHRHTPPHLSPSRPVRKVQATLYRLLLRKRQVIAVAAHVADDVVALGVSPRNVVVVPNGVDLRDLPTPLATEPGAAVRVGVLGRVDPQKGMDIFVAAAESILREGVHARFVLGIARGGFPDYEAGVLAKAYDTGVMVEVPGQNGLRFLAGLDVVAMPSRWEGSPLTLFEALALGKPVIVSNIPGIVDVVADHDVGILVSPEDPDALAKAIRLAIDQADARSRWAENARELAKMHLGSDAASKAAEIVIAAS